jgi:hypothetical protein
MRFEFPSRAAALSLLGALMVVLTATAQTNQPGQDPNEAVQNPGAPQGDTQPAGSEPPHANPGPTGDATTHTPIGAGPETMPAKFDENVAARDRIAIMARPLPLSDEQKRQIYSSVMNDTQVAVTQTTAEPATILPAWIELSALPSGLEDQIPAVRGYKYVKLQDKVLLVLPESRVVVGGSRGSAKTRRPLLMQSRGCLCSHAARPCHNET